MQSFHFTMRSKDSLVAIPFTSVSYIKECADCVEIHLIHRNEYVVLKNQDREQQLNNFYAWIRRSQNQWTPIGK